MSYIMAKVYYSLFFIVSYVLNIQYNMPPKKVVPHPSRNPRPRRNILRELDRTRLTGRRVAINTARGVSALANISTAAASQIPPLTAAIRQRAAALRDGVATGRTRREGTRNIPIMRRPTSPERHLVERSQEVAKGQLQKLLKRKREPELIVWEDYFKHHKGPPPPPPPGASGPGLTA
jgi:hypothetical protein